MNEIEKTKQAQEYEKAQAVLRAHAGYIESKERIFKFFEQVGITDKEGILERLIKENKIKYNPTVKVDWKYALVFILDKTPLEEE